MTMGAYDALKERGLRIPEDVSVVGFDNQESVANGLRPTLTTMQLPHYEMGAWAVTYLIEHMRGEAATFDVHRLPCPIVIRDSVAKP